MKTIRAPSTYLMTSESNQHPQQWEHSILTTGQPGNCPSFPSLIPYPFLPFYFHSSLCSLPPTPLWQWFQCVSCACSNLCVSVIYTVGMFLKCIGFQKDSFWFLISFSLRTMSLIPITFLSVFLLHTMPLCTFTFYLFMMPSDGHLDCSTSFTASNPCLECPFLSCVWIYLGHISKWDCWILGWMNILIKFYQLALHNVGINVCVCARACTACFCAHSQSSRVKYYVLVVILESWWSWIGDHCLGWQRMWNHINFLWGFSLHFYW